jgi:hypothetical protein
VNLRHSVMRPKSELEGTMPSKRLHSMMTQGSRRALGKMTEDAATLLKFADSAKQR